MAALTPACRMRSRSGPEKLLPVPSTSTRTSTPRRAASISAWANDLARPVVLEDVGLEVDRLLGLADRAGHRGEDLVAVVQDLGAVAPHHRDAEGARASGGRPRPSWRRGGRTGRRSACRSETRVQADAWTRSATPRQQERSRLCQTPTRRFQVDDRCDPSCTPCPPVLPARERCREHTRTGPKFQPARRPPNRCQPTPPGMIGSHFSWRFFTWRQGRVKLRRLG